MSTNIRVLLLLLVALLVYEVGGLLGHYPTISSTVGSLPWVAVGIISTGCAVLAYHFVMMKIRALRKR